MTDILSKIVANTKQEVDARKNLVSLATLTAAAHAAAPPIDFFASLQAPGVRLIAECKKKSPSKGLIVQDYDPQRLARAYEKGGAAAISVLTDEKYFGGHLRHLQDVRSAVSIPVLRKDFIIDAYQIFEARAAGADSFLLLSGVLGQKQLEEFLHLGRSLGMEALVESHTIEQLTVSLATSAKILGINNRNLKTFAVDLENSKRMCAAIYEQKPNAIAVCESGIRGPDDIATMHDAGFRAFLIGEAVATAPNPTQTVATLIQLPGPKP